MVLGPKAPARCGVLVGVFCLLSVGLAGCLGTDEVDGDAVEGLVGAEVYEYRYRGDDVVIPNHPYGWMLRVTNTQDEDLMVRAEAADPGNTSWGPVTSSGWSTDERENPQALAPGESLLFLYQWTGGYTKRLAYGVSLMASDDNETEPVVLDTHWLERGLQQPKSILLVGAGDHVTTRTVGVWVNGTSFYTNIEDLNSDPAFPAGYDREDFHDGILNAYVYDEGSDEQPPGSRDRCYVVMIEGYNELMKSQGQGSSNVRFLQPEEAYTRDGAEGHFLYGDALVFMNTVVSHEGEVTPVQSAPFPAGDCFDPENTVPLPDGPL